MHIAVICGRNEFVNTDGNARFARRHIFHAFPYRKISGPKEAAQ